MHFEKRIVALCKQYLPDFRKLSLVVSQHKKQEAVHVNPGAPTNTVVSADVGLLINSLDKRFSFDNFIVGQSNHFAFTAVKAVTSSLEVHADSNPLFIHGGVGLGKTHLLQAAAWHILHNYPDRKVVYISAEKFMYQFVNALRSNSILAFKERYRSVDVLLVDDIQFICGKGTTQEEFFHILNLLIDNNKQVIVSGDRPPSALENMTDRIKSRLGGGLVADIHNTTYELRLGILNSKVSDMNVNVPKDVLEFLSEKITSNIRELEGALNRIIAHARLTRVDIAVESTRVILKDLLKANEKTVTVDDIQKKIAKHFSIDIADISSARRARDVALPRQIGMYLSKSLTSLSLADIGKKFGKKDHTTVRHAVSKVEAMLKNDPYFADEVRTLAEVIRC
jgi:chromosomal replication initiator protein